MHREERRETSKEFAICGHCGKKVTSNDPNLIFQANDGQLICYDCVEQIYNYYKDEIGKLREGGRQGKPSMTPQTMKEYLDDYIIGQDKAKKILSTAIYNHYKMIEMKEANPEYEGEKSNICIVGPSGCGKTAMLKRLARIMDVPFTVGDCTSLTESGFVGSDVESVIRNLLSEANGDIKKAEKGIVYLDEVDKLRRGGENPSISTDPGHEGAQQALLKIIEGTMAEVPQKGQRKHPDAPVTRVDTSNILFIVGGAFEGIEKIIARRQHTGKSSMGFGATLEKDRAKEYNKLITDIRTDDLKKFGMMPEFIGRLPIICPMTELTEEDLKRILVEPKNSIVRQYQALFLHEGVTLEFTDEAIEWIAHEAIERKTGARSLRGIMEEVLGEVMYSMPGDEDIESVTVRVSNGDIEAEKMYSELRKTCG